MKFFCRSYLDYQHPEKEAVCLFAAGLAHFEFYLLIGTKFFNRKL